MNRAARRRGEKPSFSANVKAKLDNILDMAKGGVVSSLSRIERGVHVIGDDLFSLLQHVEQQVTPKVLGMVDEIHDGVERVRSGIDKVVDNTLPLFFHLVDGIEGGVQKVVGVKSLADGKIGDTTKGKEVVVKAGPQIRSTHYPEGYGRPSNITITTQTISKAEIQGGVGGPPAVDSPAAKAPVVESVGESPAEPQVEGLVVKKSAVDLSAGEPAVVEEQTVVAEQLAVEPVVKKIINHGVEPPSIPEQFVGTDVVQYRSTFPDDGLGVLTVKITEGEKAYENHMATLGEKATEMTKCFGQNAIGQYATVKDDKIEVISFALTKELGNVKHTIGQIETGMKQASHLLKSHYFDVFIPSSLRKLLSDIQRDWSSLSLQNFEKTSLWLKDLRSYNTILSDDGLHGFIMELEKRIKVLDTELNKENQLLLNAKSESAVESVMRKTRDQWRDVFGRFTTAERKAEQDEAIRKGVNFIRKGGKVIPVMPISGDGEGVTSEAA